MTIKTVLYFIALIFSNKISRVYTANILCLNVHNGPDLWSHAIIEELAANAHNLTIISSNVEQSVATNIHYVSLNDSDSANMLEPNNGNVLQEAPTGCAEILKGFENLLNYAIDNNIDLILFDFTRGPCLIPFLHYFNYPPMIAVTSFTNSPRSTGGAHDCKSPEYFTFTYNNGASLWQRMLNIVAQAYDTVYRQYIFFPKVDALMRDTLPVDFPYAAELQKNAIMLIINEDTYCKYPQQLWPNSIHFNNFHFQTPKSLPTELDEFILNGVKGAIFISFDSNNCRDLLSKEIQIMFIQAFREIPQYNFLWKFESREISEEIPKNVLINAWLPQIDILMHPKIKAFVTHSDSQILMLESWHTSPIIRLPFLCDQKKNMRPFMQRFSSDKVMLENLTIAVIRDTILNVLDEVEIVGEKEMPYSRYQDQPRKKLDQAVWWIERILKNLTENQLKLIDISAGSAQPNIFDIYLYVFGLLTLTLYCLKKLFLESPKKIVGRKIKSKVNTLLNAPQLR